MHIHYISNDQGTAFVSAQDAGRERPRNLQFADILSVDLVELRIPMIGIIAGRHYPVFWVLRHLRKLVVCLSGTACQDSRSTQTGRKQKSAHPRTSLLIARKVRDAQHKECHGRHALTGTLSGGAHSCKAPSVL